MQGLHAILAVMTSQPVLVLSPQEAKALAERIWALADYYQISLAGPGSLWVGLFATLGMIYVPRIGQMRADMLAKRRARPTGEAAISPFGMTQPIPSAPVNHTADTPFQQDGALVQ